jgi:glycerol kinase
MKLKELIEKVAQFSYQQKTGIEWRQCADYVKKAWIEDTERCIKIIKSLDINIGTVDKYFTEDCPTCGSDCWFKDLE